MQKKIRVEDNEASEGRRVLAAKMLSITNLFQRVWSAVNRRVLRK